MTPEPLSIVGPDSYDAVCAVIDGCLTCGDVAVPVTVIEAGEPDALCEDEHGQQGTVGVELVAPVAVGERLLVHGGVAISRLDEEDSGGAPVGNSSSAIPWALDQDAGAGTNGSGNGPGNERSDLEIRR